jgi:hypothetical protein
MHRVFRALVLPAATLLAAAGIVAGSAGTAQATVVCVHKGAISLSGGVVSAWAETWCHNAPDPEIWTSPDPVVIKRLTAGTWTTIASGTESVDYHCVGTATNSYRLDNGFIIKEIDAVACG